jgi:hypothetical protein
MKFINFAAVLFLAAACCSAQVNELDEITSDLAKRRAEHVEYLDSLTELSGHLNRIALVCTASEKQNIIGPCIQSITAVKDLSNDIISSIDAYAKLHKSITASKNKAGRDSLIRVYKVYPEVFLYFEGRVSAIYKYHDIEGIKALAAGYGILF